MSNYFVVNYYATKHVDVIVITRSANDGNANIKHQFWDTSN